MKRHMHSKFCVLKCLFEQSLHKTDLDDVISPDVYALATSRNNLNFEISDKSSFVCHIDKAD